MITGINHINLSVHDLTESLTFYVDVLGLTLLAKWDQGAYLRAGDLWFCLNLDKHTKKFPSAEYTHLAFHVEPENFASLSQK